MVDKIILYDTEYTAWEGSQQRRWSEPWEHREIIQIAAVLVDVRAGFAEMACFDRLVKPQRNPVLSGYITALTGIAQTDIDSQGIPFAGAYRDFFAFCQQGCCPLFSWGDDPGVIQENCALTGLSFADFHLDFHDIRDVLEAAGIETRHYSSGTVYRSLDLPFSLPGHNALNDVRSLAVTLAELARRKRLPRGWPDGPCHS